MKNTLKKFSDMAFFLLMIITGLHISFSATAATNQCYRSSAKDANAWVYDFGTISLTATDNTTGVVKNNVAEFNMLGDAKLWCDCSSPGPYFFSSSMNLPDDGDNWYVMNDYLDAKLEINFNSSWKTIPYQDASTGPGNSGACQTQTTIGGLPTGGNGRLSLKIRRPFVGESFIPLTKIAQECVAVTTQGIPCTPGNATYTYSFSGHVVVPQNCEINAGTQVVVPLGTFYEGDFNNVGQKPENFTPKTFNIPIQCNDASAVANLTLRIQGTPSATLPNALQSDNPDVGVVITNSNGDPLIPNDSSSVIPFELDDSLRTNITLHAYPVGTTGNTPTVGQFTTLAYLRVDFS